MVFENQFDAAGRRADTALKEIPQGLSKAKRDAAAWGLARALGGAAPAVGDAEMRLFVHGICQASPQFASISIGSMGAQQGAALRESVGRCITIARLFTSLAAFVAARPIELERIAEDERYVHLTMNTAIINARRVYLRGIRAVVETVATPEAQAALLALAQGFRGRALAGGLYKMDAGTIWFSAAACGIHPPLSWVGEAGAVRPAALAPEATLKALREAGAALNWMTTSEGVQEDGYIEVPATVLARAFANASTGDLSPVGANIRRRTDGSPILYLVRAREDAGTHASVLQGAMALMAAGAMKPELHWQQFNVVSLLLPVFYPGYCLPLPLSASPADRDVILGAAVALMKFALGPAPATLAPVCGVSPRLLLAWYSSVAFVDAGCVTIYSSPASENLDSVEEHLRRERNALAPFALKFLDFIAQERDAMEGVFLRGELGPFYDAPGARDSIADVASSLAKTLLSMKETLRPALVPDDALGLNLLAKLVVIENPSEQREGQLLTEAAVSAAAADPRDEARCVARARMLAGLDCAYLGCSSVRVQRAAMPKKCAGCGCACYCSPADQRADWKAHRVACKAIQAENSS